MRTHCPNLRFFITLTVPVDCTLSLVRKDPITVLLLLYNSNNNIIINTLII